MSDADAPRPAGEAALEARLALRGEKVADLRASLSDRKRALLARLVETRAPSTPSTLSTPWGADAARCARRPGSGPAVLSFAQEHLWFLGQQAESPAENVSAVLGLGGRLEEPALAASLGEIVRRQEILRTRVATVGTELRQVVSPPPPFVVPRVDLADVPAARREGEARRLAAGEPGRAFDLARGPLLRAVLLRLSAADWRVLVSLHPAAGDAGSIEILVGELAAQYGAAVAGIGSPLPELPIQYADFAIWQRGRLAGRFLADEIAHWRRELAGAPDVLELPSDRPRPVAPSHRGGELSFTLPPELATALAALAERQEATLEVALLAGFQALLGRWSGQDDLLVGLLAAGRSLPETAGLIGPFANLLPLRARLAGEPTGGQRLDQARAATLAAHAHQELPFDRLVAELRPARDRGRHPLVQAVLAVAGAPAVPELPGLTLHRSAPAAASLPFDLRLAVTAVEGGLCCRLGYARDLFDGATIARLAGHLERLLAGLVEQPARRLVDIPLLAAAERHQLEVEWGGVQSGAAELEPVWKAVEAQARQRPDGVALTFAGDLEASLTYAELDLQAARLARRLRQEGVGPEVRVGLLVERSPELVVAILGIWKAGGAYLPLDPALPDARLSFLIEDALSGGVVLVQEPLSARLAELAVDGLRIVSLAGEGGGEDREVSAPALPESRPRDLAYLIYTSGTTGRPKAVAVEHGSLAHTLRATAEAFGLRSTDRMSCLAPFSFDIFLFELLAPLVAGGAVVLFPLRPALDLQRVAAALPGLTALHAVPALMREIVAAAAAAARDGSAIAPALRLAFVGGDAVPPDLLAGMRRAFPAARRVVLYGPTEGTILAASRECGEEPGAVRHPLGRPLPGALLRVLGRGGEAVAAGIPGELYLGGRGVARGYLGRPELTAAKFVPSAGGRWYRSGDLARFLPDGSLEFLGRIDHQVKVNGFRIELGEVESALAEQPEVAAAAVVARAEPAGGLRLVAFVVLDPQQPLPVRELRERLRLRLPDYMVPALLVPLPALPRTVAGKVDRQALQTVALPAVSDQAVDPATGGAGTPIEELLAGIWSDLLGVEAGRVGGASDFFELGGHSLLATRVVSRVRDLFRVELSVHQLFAASTLRALAAVITTGATSPGDAGAAVVPPLRPVPRDAALPLSFAQERLWFLDALQPGSVAYNIPAALRLRGHLRTPALAATLIALVRRHESLRTTFLTRDGRPFQVISPAGGLALPVVDLRGLGAAGRERQARRLAEREARRPFDLVAGPVLRATLLHLAAGEAPEHLLLLTLHHIAGDGWSVGVFVRELGELYRAQLEGRPSPLAPLALQYADFAAWQREWLTETVLAGQLAWWQERLAGVPDHLDLPLDRPRSPAGRRRAATVALPLAAGLSDDLAALSRRAGATQFMTLFAGFTALLCRLTGQERLAVGSPVANRTRTEVEGLIGMFVNTLALAADLRGDPDFAALLVRTREMALGAYAHQDLPFERLVEAFQAGRSLDSSAIFQVMLVVQNAPLPSFELPGLSLSAALLEVGSAKFDLILSFNESGGRLGGSFEHDADLFDGTTVERWARYLTTLLAGAVADPGLPLSELPLLAAAERQAVVGGGAGAQAGPTAVEAVLSRLCCELLGVERLGVEDRLLDLGEPATWPRLLSRVLTTFEVELRPCQLLANPTIAALASLVVATVEAQ